MASSANEQCDRKPVRGSAVADRRGETIPDGEIRSAFDLAVTAEARKEVAAVLRGGEMREGEVTGMKASS